MTIMATSADERGLVDSFLQNSTSRELVELIVNHKTKGKLYSVDGEGYMTLDDAINQALALYINQTKDAYEYSNFYESHKSMILSILKTSTENEADAQLFKEKLKALKKLMKV